MAILGLDYGEKRIGVALASGEGRLAVPLGVIERSDETADLDKVLALAEEYGIERIVIGLPRSLNGSIGPQAEEVLAFTRAISEHVGITVDTWDERFTSVAADSLFADAGVKRERRKGKRDAMAAAITLQGYLDDRTHSKE